MLKLKIEVEDEFVKFTIETNNKENQIKKRFKNKEEALGYYTTVENQLKTLSELGGD